MFLEKTIHSPFLSLGVLAVNPKNFQRDSNILASLKEDQGNGLMFTPNLKLLKFFETGR